MAEIDWLLKTVPVYVILAKAIHQNVVSLSHKSNCSHVSLSEKIRLYIAGVFLLNTRFKNIPKILKTEYPS